jgi:hypothetical protein
MGFTAAGISPTTVTSESSAGADDASQLAPLGFILTVPDGDNGAQEWIYVKNTDAADMNVVGTVVGRAAGSATYQVITCPVGETTARVVGVVQHTIGRNGFGFVLRKGVGTILCDTGFSANSGLIVGNGTAGRADAGTALTSPTFAYSLAAVATGETGSAFINCKG